MEKKKAANGAGSIRQRQDGKWEGRYSYGFNPATGKPHRGSVYADTKTGCRKKLTAVLSEIDAGNYFVPEKLTFAKWLDIWTENHLKNVKFRTAKHYKAQVETHIKPKLGAVKLSALSAPMILNFYNGLAKDGHKLPARDKDGKIIKDKYEFVPLSPKSIRNIHGILTRSLSDAVEMGMIRENPAEKLKGKLPKAEVKKEIHPLNDEQVKLFLSALKDEEYRNLFTFILFTGVREGEGCGLTWDCIDFEKGTVTIKQQIIKKPLKDGGFDITSTKNGKKRVLTPPQGVLDCLKAQKAEQAKLRLQLGDMWQGLKDKDGKEIPLVFTNAFGSYLSPQTVYAHYKKIANTIGAEGTCVHDLRHTYAVLSLQNGDDIKTVQENLGHATAAFTLDVYASVSDVMRRNSADRMQNYMMAAMGV